MEILSVVQGAWSAFATKITVFLPKLLGAVIIALAGLAIAKLVQFAAGKFLRLIRLDSASEKIGVKDFLTKGGISKAPSEIIALLLYWFIMVFVLIAAMDAMGLPIVSGILNDIFLFIPNVVAAILVLVLGILVGSPFSSVVRTAASNAGLAAAEALGKIAYYAVLVFAGAIALIQLGIGVQIITLAFGLFLGAVALAAGLSFGLGGRDMAADYLKKWLAKK